MSAKVTHYLAAAVSGLLITLSFPNWNWDILVWIGLAPLFWAIQEERPWRAFFIGAVFGVAHYLTLLYWIYHVIQFYGGLPWFLSIAVLLLLTCYLALYPAAFCTVTSYLTRSLNLPLMAVAPFVWVSLELLRAHLFTGFPWGLLGQALYERLAFIQIADLAGVYGISLIIVAANAALYSIFLGSGTFRKRFISLPTAVAFCLVAVTFAYGQFRLDRNEHPEAKKIRVALVQGNIDQSLKWEPSNQQATIDTYETLSRKAVHDGAQLIVWPETALPFYYGLDQKLTRQVRAFLQQSGVYFVLGSPAVIQKGEQLELRNRAYLISPQGATIGFYDKTHLVPYGEYVPLRSWFPFIKKLVVAAGNFSSGEPGKTLHYPGGELGPLICFESIFPYLSRAQTNNGAELLVNMTNDAWFGRSSAPYQHMSMLVFRCVENRRYGIRAANTGISAIISDKGRILAQSPIFKPYLIEGEAELLDGKTFYMRFGDVFAYICALFSAAFIAWAWLTNRRYPRSI